MCQALGLCKGWWGRGPGGGFVARSVAEAAGRDAA